MLTDAAQDSAAEVLDRVFFALSDPVRRAILERLGEQALLVSELAAPFDISLQAVSRRIHVLVRTGLVRQGRTGHISRCRLLAGPIFTAAVWMNRYSKHWQEPFHMLSTALALTEQRRSAGRHKRRKRASTPRDRPKEG